MQLQIEKKTFKIATNMLKHLKLFRVFSGFLHCFFSLILTGFKPLFKPVSIRKNPAFNTLGELANFGNVIDVECETYGKGSVFQGIYTETRLGRINLKKHIPNYRRIGGFEA